VPYKEVLSEVLKDKIRDCTLCFRRNKKKVFLGYGTLAPTVLFISDIAVIPETFKPVLEYLGLDYEDVFYTGMVKCTYEDELGLPEKCAPWLITEVKILTPRLIVCLGEEAKRSFDLCEKRKLDAFETGYPYTIPRFALPHPNVIDKEMKLEDYLTLTNPIRQRLLRLLSVAGYAPTPKEVVHYALKLANLQQNELFVDLGAGDGRTLFIANQKFGARAIGYEIDLELVEEVRQTIEKKKLEQVQIFWEYLFDADLTEADLVYCFLSYPAMDRLKQKFRELKSSARVISLFYPIPDIKSIIMSKIDHGYYRIYIYSGRDLK